MKEEEKEEGEERQEGERKDKGGETYPNNIHLVTASKQYRYA